MKPRRPAVGVALTDALRHGLLLRLTQLDAQRHQIAELLRQLPKEPHAK